MNGYRRLTSALQAFIINPQPLKQTVRQNYMIVYQSDGLVENAYEVLRGVPKMTKSTNQCF